MTVIQLLYGFSVPIDLWIIASERTLYSTWAAGERRCRKRSSWLHINIPFSMQNHNWDIYVSMQHPSWTLMISIHSRLSWQPGRLRDNRGKQLQNWRQSNELRCVAHLCEGPHGHFCVKVRDIEMKSARYIVYLYICICIPMEHCLNKHMRCLE